MFAKIKSYFKDLRIQVFRTTELAAYSRKDISIILEDISVIRKDIQMLKAIERDARAEVYKILSSIEMEFLMQLRSSLDNNFEGKQDL